MQLSNIFVSLTLFFATMALATPVADANAEVESIDYAYTGPGKGHG